jgi:hypothetical protein
LRIWMWRITDWHKDICGIYYYKIY